ncbi:MAG: MFS transporter [Proteobacteria bacterium]|nr:MFS transporter [Pseudomonadota bacterium]
MSEKPPDPAAGRSLVVLVPFLLLGPLDYAFRINSGLIAPALVDEFGIGPADLGFMTSTFFVAFALAQLPMGLALDRFGPFRVTAAALAVAAVGAVIYVTATDFVGLVVGRFLIGVGMAPSLTAYITALRLWFPADRLASLVAFQMALTALGAMVASKPMEALLTVVPWRSVVVGLVGACVLLAVATLAVSPRREAADQTPPADLDRSFRVYGVILSSFRFWRFAPVAMGGMGAAIAYQSLWAPLWLRDVAGFDASAQAWVLFAMFGAVLAGNLAVSWLTARVGGETRALQAIAFGGLGMTILMQILLAATRGGFAPGVLWIASSLFFACPLVAYAIVTRAFLSETAGRAASAVTAMTFAAVFLTQWLTGVVIGAFPGSTPSGYAVEGYLAAQWAVIGLQVLAVLWSLLAGCLETRADRKAATTPGQLS